MNEASRVNGAEGLKKRVRGRWTEQQRQRIVEASLVAGASINAVAEQHGVRPNLLTAWRRRHAAAAAVSKRNKAPVRFAAVRVSTVASDSSIEIDLSNRIVRVRGIVDAGMLREVLAATR
jgi:transposase-like protein